MGVYVDDTQTPAKSLPYVWSNMFADTREELLAMADALGIRREHIQNPGEANEHFRVAQTKREDAIKLGALPVKARDVVKLIRHKRSQIAHEEEFARVLAETTPLEELGFDEFDTPDPPPEPAPEPEPPKPAPKAKGIPVKRNSAPRGRRKSDT